MTGLSYPGITQLFVARTHPPQPRGDHAALGHRQHRTRRCCPGGILNDGFALEWITEVLDKAEPYGQGWEQARVDGGDTVCEENQLLHGQKVDNVAEARRTTLYDPARCTTRSTRRTFVDEINVPVFLAGAWQDEQTGPFFFTAARPVHSSSPVDALHRLQRRPPRRLRAAGPGRVEGLPRISTSRSGCPIDRPTLARRSRRSSSSRSSAAALHVAARSLRRRTRRAKTRWPRYRGRAAAARASSRAAPAAPTWARRWRPSSTHFAALAAAATHAARASTSSRRLAQADAARPRPRAASTFDARSRRRASAASSRRAATSWDPLPALRLAAAAAPGNAVVFETAPLAERPGDAGHRRAPICGCARTVDDADLEVNLTEVRPDGQEMYVQSGWLRASYRAARRRPRPSCGRRRRYLEKDAGAARARRVDAGARRHRRLRPRLPRRLAHPHRSSTRPATAAPSGASR